MPDQNGGQDPAANSDTESQSQPPVSPPTPQQYKMGQPGEQSSRNTVDPSAKLERDIKIGEICLIAINLLLLITTIVIAKIYYGQLEEMRKATVAAQISAEASKKASDTAAATLMEIQKGSGDTHELAVQAKNQADRTKDVADAAKKQSAQAETQAKATSSLATEARETFTASKTNFLIDHRPYITVENISMIKDPSGHDAIHITLTNSGRTPAVNFQLPPSKMEVSTGSLPMIVTTEGKPAYSVIGSDKSTSYTFPFTINEPQLAQFNNSQISLTVHAKALYEDLFGCKHWTEFCMEYRKIWNEFRYCETALVDPVSVCTKK